MKDSVSQYVIEIRYAPNPKFLDFRGKIAEELAKLNLDLWNITDNRVDFSSSRYKGITAFFSYKNLGLSYFSNAKKYSFVTKAVNFSKVAWQYLAGYPITRIGVRSIVLVETKSMKIAHNILKEQLLNKDPLKHKMVDLALVYEYVTEAGPKIRLKIGPMGKKQSKEIFTETEVPDSSVFLDFDYFQDSDLEDFKFRDLEAFIEASLSKSEEAKNFIEKILTDGSR